MTNELNVIKAQDYGLEESKGNEIKQGLSHILAERTLLQEGYEACLKMEVTAENIPTFRELRLKIRDNRTKGIEVWHKNNKAFFLAGGNFVDAIKRKEIAVNEQMEEKLMDSEKYFERLEAERLAQIETDRKALLAPLTDVIPVGLGQMEQEVFDNYLSGLKVAYNARIEAEQKAEAERQRIEAENRLHQERKDSILDLWGYMDTETKALHFGQLDEADWTNIVKSLGDKKQAHEAEQERIRVENARLEKERIEAEKKAAEEREKAEIERKRIEAERQKEIEAERKKQAELQAQLKAKEEAEAKTKLEAEQKELQRIEAEKKAALAPDKEKLTAWINSLSMPTCELTTESGKSVHNVIAQKFEAFKGWANAQIKTL